MKNRDGQVIYVGKAKALKNRVSQYFQSDSRHHTEDHPHGFKHMGF